MDNFWTESGLSVNPLAWFGDSIYNVRIAENFDEHYERSLYLIDRLSAEVQADIKESREFRQEMREMREESRKDREESRGRMDRLEAILHESIEDGKQLSKDTARSMEQTNKRLESLGIAQGQAAEDSLRLKARMESLARTVDRTNQTMEKLGIIQGQVAEDLFYRNLPVLLKDYHITREDLLRNIIGEMKREYDLVAVNSSHIFVFEVKNKLRSDDIERFHDVQLPDFKLNFPDYANHTVYGGIGALVVRDDLQRRAEKLGLFVLTQGENESAHLHTPRKLLEF